jgi:hypothetical protein
MMDEDMATCPAHGEDLMRIEENGRAMWVCPLAGCDYEEDDD